MSTYHINNNNKNNNNNKPNRTGDQCDVPQKLLYPTDNNDLMAETGATTTTQR